MSEQREAAAVVGKPRPRIDGPLKVTGVARYASDRRFPGMLYAVPVGATVASGEVVGIDGAVALAMPGVKAVLHRGNIGPLFRIQPNPAGLDDFTFMDEARPPFADDTVRYWGQYVALAVADSVERAKAAADAVVVRYRRREPQVAPPELGGARSDEVAQARKEESSRGDVGAAFASAPVKLDRSYRLPAETHNPIELHATVAVWDGPDVTLYETSQGVVNHRNVLAQMLGIPRERVRVVSEFLGSGFGSKLWPWAQSALAAAAARQLGAPVKLVLSRPMMFHAVGHRPALEQRVRLGCDRSGKLVSLQHDWVNATSLLDDYKENCGEVTAFMYDVENLRISSQTVRRTIGTPTSMRGPGAVPGLFATESAMDELAVALGVDPVELRIRNEPAIDRSLGVPFSSRHLVECMRTGAERFGWARRDPKPGTMRAPDGAVLGWGMAAATWVAARFGCKATVELRDDGTARVTSAIQDIGTGTYTVMAQIAAEKLGLPISRVEVALGDTRLPSGCLSGGSMATASLVPAIHAAADKAVEALFAAATTGPGAALTGRRPADLRFRAGEVVAGDASRSLAAVLKEAGLRAVFGTGEGQGTFGEKNPKLSSHSFGAHFVEVTWRPEIARLRVSRMVSVIDAGRILNPLAGRNQIEGALVMGIGMALLEETSYEPRYGAPINASLADYAVAVNADAPALDVHFLDYPDTNLNALGARGIGEIGLAGTAAAITNAVHHATGVRVRELPVKLEMLL